MNNINVRLSPDDALEIESNLVHLSRTLGYKLNSSQLIRHVLKNCTSKHSLYSLGFISFQELHSSVTFERGGKQIKLKPRRMRK